MVGGGGWKEVCSFDLRVAMSGARRVNEKRAGCDGCTPAAGAEGSLAISFRSLPTPRDGAALAALAAGAPFSANVFERVRLRIASAEPGAYSLCSLRTGTAESVLSP